ncbi:CPBP family intramembrane metalloprotease [Rhodocyclaceae bacterium]|nr:CPBP family intramembrane metalloprotease [Rhodocyclaceae bacterium]
MPLRGSGPIVFLFRSPSVNRPDPAPSSWSRRALPVLAVGLLGIIALMGQAPPAALLAAAPELAALPPWAQRAALALNPLLLVMAASAVGAALAHRVGLRSLLAGTAPARQPLRLWAASVGWGLFVGIAVQALDRLLSPAWSEGWRALVQAPPDLAGSRLVVGLLYGGLAEEVIARWGAMSLLAWALLRALGPAHARLALGLAVALSALVFGAAHLPVLAVQVELETTLVARTLLLNGLGGVVYGWLFCRHHLEAAMAAHAATHLALAALQPGLGG